MNQRMTEEQFEEMANEITAPFLKVAEAIDLNGVEAFDKPEAVAQVFEHYDRLAERLFRHSCGEPWAHRENCLWVRLRAALRESQQPMRVSIQGEGPDEAIYLIDSQGNHVLWQTSVDERLAQENWLKHRLLEFSGELQESIKKAVSVVDILVNCTPQVEAQAAQQLLHTYLGLLSGSRQVDNGQELPAWLKRSMRLQTMQEAREILWEMTMEGANIQAEIYPELAKEGYSRMFGQLAEGLMSEEQVSKLVDRVGLACSKPAVAVIAKGNEVMKKWLEMRKNDEK